LIEDQIEGGAHIALQAWHQEADRS
jgi:hypothetical protein